MPADSAVLPPSRARWLDPLLFGGVSIALYVRLRATQMTTPELVVLLAAAAALVMCGLELWEARRELSRGPGVPWDAAVHRGAISWLGAMAGGSLVLLGWWLLPEFERPSYRSFFETARALLPLAPFVMAGCILAAERRLGPVEDDRRHFGLLVIGRWREADWGLVRQGLIGWMIKGVFFPLNFSAAVAQIDRFRGLEGEVFTAAWPKAVYVADAMIFAALLIAIMPGYLFSSRLFSNEIKKADCTWFGWMVTLACYPPLNAAVSRGWAQYQYKIELPWMQPWALWSEAWPTLCYLIGGTLLLLELIHWWSEAHFGLRSSNLSNRGILTNGPYRFCKHPIYLVKCIAWFIIWVPIGSGRTVVEGLRWFLLFSLWCSIYVMRAWAEEKLLSDDPDYVAYARWIDRHGLLRWIGLLIPMFRYEWRLKYWERQGLADSTATR